MRRYIFLSSRRALLRNCERLLYVPLREKKKESGNKRRCVRFMAVSLPRHFSGHSRQADLRIRSRFLSLRNSGICFHWDLAFCSLTLFLPPSRNIFASYLLYCARDVSFLYLFLLDKYCHLRQKRVPYCTLIGIFSS